MSRLIAYGVIAANLEANFGGDSLVPGASLLIAPVLIVTLGMTYKSVFADRWPN